LSILDQNGNQMSDYELNTNYLKHKLWSAKAICDRNLKMIKESHKKQMLELEEESDD
jgi:hypothetical protein